MVLPNSPASAGLKASGVKELFYKFIRVFAKIINEHLNTIKNEASTALDAHGSSELSHNDIRMAISDLITRDTELGNQIATGLKEHDNDNNAHETIRLWLKQLQDKITSVSNLASGKSKIIPVKDIYEMMSKLTPEINVGDKFVLLAQNVPDFTVFEKNSQNTEASELSQLSLLLGLELEPGKSYICGGYLLVASESGVDTSLFAKQTELDLTNKELATKQKALVHLTQSQEQITVSDNTVHNLGLRQALELVLPENISNGFSSLVVFRSGSVPTAITSNGIIFTQDDSLRGELVPVSNRLYELHIRCVDGVVLCTVIATDFEVIE